MNIVNFLSLYILSLLLCYGDSHVGYSSIPMPLGSLEFTYHSIGMPFRWCIERALLITSIKYVHSWSQSTSPSRLTKNNRFVNLAFQTNLQIIHIIKKWHSMSLCYILPGILGVWLVSPTGPFKNACSRVPMWDAFLFDWIEEIR